MTYAHPCLLKSCLAETFSNSNNGSDMTFLYPADTEVLRVVIFFQLCVLWYCLWLLGYVRLHKTCPLCPPSKHLSPPSLTSPWHPGYCVLLHNLCHLQVSPHHDTLSISSSSNNLCYFHISPCHNTLSISFCDVDMYVYIMFWQCDVAVYVYIFWQCAVTVLSVACRSTQPSQKSWISCENNCWRKRRRSQSWRQRGTTRGWVQSSVYGKVHSSDHIYWRPFFTPSLFTRPPPVHHKKTEKKIF